MSETEQESASKPPITPNPKPKLPYRKPRASTLTKKQEAFVSYFLIHKNASLAARNAGYKPKNSDVTGHRLVNLPLVRAAIEQGLEAVRKANELSPARILEELRRIALFDYAGCYDENGKLKPIHQLPPEARACIASVETRRINLESGDGQTDEVTRIRLVDKTKALAMLAEHLQLLVPRLDVNGTIVIRHELLTGQQDTASLPAHHDVIDVSPIESDSKLPNAKGESQNMPVNIDSNAHRSRGGDR